MQELFYGNFWTNENEMIVDIENAGYEVLWMDEYELEVIESDNITQYFKLIRAGQTITIDFRG